MSSFASFYSKTLLAVIFIKSIDIVRNLIIASKIGVSNSADIFSAISIIPEGIIILIGIDSLRGVVNSEYTSLISQSKLEIIQNSFNNLFKIILFLGIVLLILLMFFKNNIVDMLLPGFDEAKKIKAYGVAQIIFPTIIMSSLIALFQAIYNSFKKFTFPVLVFSISSLTILISILFPPYNNDIIYNLSFGMIFGNVLVLLVLTSNIRSLGLKFKIKGTGIDLTTKRILKSCAIVLPVVFFNQIYFYSRNFFASNYGEGSIASISYAATVPNTIMVIAFGTIFGILVSNLSTSYTLSKGIEAKRLFTNAFKILFFLFVPIVVCLVLFKIEILKIVYLRGNLNLEDIEKISKPFVWEALGLLSWVAYTLPTSVFLAKKKYKMLAIIGSIMYSFGILLNYIFTHAFGYYGISVSTFFTLGIYGIILIYFSRKFQGRYKDFLKPILFIILSGLTTFLIGSFIIKQFAMRPYEASFLENIVSLVFGCIIVSIVYLSLSQILKVNYLSNILNILKKK
ncbi:MAG: lipid II flippase MurJ [Ignavibacteria bacterium]